MQKLTIFFIVLLMLTNGCGNSTSNVKPKDFPSTQYPQSKY